jgi:hypothetical protein
VAKRSTILLILVAGAGFLLLKQSAVPYDEEKRPSDPFYRDAPDRVLTDADVAAIPGKFENVRATPHALLRLGRHNGTMLLDGRTCGDICPDYTMQVIRYDLDPGPACDKAGGVTVERSVPQAASIGLERFCIPLPLAIAECRKWRQHWDAGGPIGRHARDRPDCSAAAIRARSVKIGAAAPRS